MKLAKETLEIAVAAQSPAILNHLSVRNHMDQRQVAKFAAAFDRAENISESLDRALDMSKLGELTIASHGAMLDAQIGTVTEMLAILLSIKLSAQEE